MTTPADRPTRWDGVYEPDGGASLAAWAEARRPPERDPLAATDGLVWPVGAYWDGFRWVRWLDPLAPAAPAT